MFALKKNNKNFLLGLCALIVAVAMVSVGSTFALFDPQPNFETNIVVIGDVAIELNDEYYEEQPDYDPDDPEKNYNEDNPPEFSPDIDVTKYVSVTNIGNNPCYVRVLMRRIWKDNNDQDISDKISYTINSDFWYKGDDYEIGGVEYECYYYKLPLAPGVRAENLIEKFHIGDFDSATAGGSTGDINVLAHAVQSENITPSTSADSPIVKNSAGMIIKWNITIE